ANSYCFWIRHDTISGHTFASFVVGDVLPTNAGIYVSENNGLSWTPYKIFNYHMPYAGSPLASNFVNGIMYYSIATDNSWQNGIKLYFDNSIYFEDGFESGGFGAWSGVSG